MNTLIELYDERAIENILAPDMFRPQRIVYLCPGEIVRDRTRQEKLAAFFQRRGWDPELVFLDEPFSGLDPINADVFKSVLAELIADGRYIVMSSHQMTTVEEYCRDLVLLTRGRTVLQGNLRQIKAGYGHTNLSVSCGEDITAQAQRHGLRLLEKAADHFEFKIDGDDSARAFLSFRIASSTGRL